MGSCSEERGSKEMVGKSKGIVLDLFTGRGASLNLAIANVLGVKQPQTTRQIGKNVTNIPEFKDTSLSTVNKRARALQEQGYLKKTETKERVGGLTNYYELTPKANLEMYLYYHREDNIFGDLADESAEIILADLINAKENR